MSTAIRLAQLGSLAALEPPSDPVETETVDCPCCGGGDHDTVIVADDPLTGLGGLFQVVRCRACRLCFTNPRPTAHSLGLFYPADYRPHFERQNGPHSRRSWRGRLEWALLRQRYGYLPRPTDAMTGFTSAVARVVIRRTRARERWVPFRAPGRLLDFGCGAGNFLRQMREYGWNVEGLDFSPRMVQALREKGEFPTHLGTLPHRQVAAGSFDAITMWHSLEHVPRPREILQAASDALRPGGLLAVSVPNFASWSFRQFRAQWTGLALPRHLVHFIPQTLGRMVEAAGLRVLSVEQIGRDGWIRKSARRTAEEGKLPQRLRLLRRKGPAGLVARWTELTAQADTFRLIAEKI